MYQTAAQQHHTYVILSGYSLSVGINPECRLSNHTTTKTRRYACRNAPILRFDAKDDKVIILKITTR